MKLIVNPHKIEIDKSPVNEREINITKCEFEFAEEITSDYVKEAYFTFKGTTYKQIIANNECSIPNEVLTEKGQIEIGVVAYLVESEVEIKRYNPSPAYFNTWVGSLKDKVENTEPITPSEMEQFEQALNDGLNEVANVDIDSEQLSNGTSVTITNRYGESKITYVYNGQDGADGQDGVDGKDAKINGVNTLTLEAGDNITLNQSGSTLTISSTGGAGGTSDYTDLTNKPQINGVTLSGNKTSSQLGINIPDVSNFITKDVNNLTYYTKTSDLPTIPTNVSAFNNDAGYLTSHQDLSNYITKSQTSGLVKNDGTIDTNTYLTQHQDISGKLDTSKVKSSYSTTSGDVYSVTYINSTLGDIETLLGGI